ncbi:MAG: Hpt domain-containing protein [Clostridium sp.]|nr:Hpt domain-containing protein [Clostridium sp.]
MTEEKKQKLLEAGIDFDGLSARIPLKEDFILRLLGKFPKEQCYGGLINAMEAKDYEEAFKHAHNLKGVSGNLEMSRLTKAASELTEKLRAKKYDDLAGDYETLKDEYQQVLTVINEEILS